jgi:hypothetical protein
MEREQCEAERARLNRQKRKEEFQRLKAFYGYVSKTHPEIVSAFGFEEACGKNVETVSN